MVVIIIRGGLRCWFPPFLISVICDRELVLSQREREREVVARSIFICLGGVDKDSVRVTQLQSLEKECEV